MDQRTDVDIKPDVGIDIKPSLPEVKMDASVSMLGKLAGDR